MQLTVSTLFTAQDVRRHLSSEEGIDKAIGWCKDTAVTRVFIETFRGNYMAERNALEHAQQTVCAMRESTFPAV